MIEREKRPQRLPSEAVQAAQQEMSLGQHGQEVKADRVSEKRMRDGLTPMMQLAIGFARCHGGQLTRHPGGFWAGSEFTPFLGGGGSTDYFGTSTVEALVARGIGDYTAWKASHGREFPIEMTLKEPY